jgi:hypothetical protein
MSKPNEIRDRAALTDHIAEAMQNGCRSTTIDTLLTRPLDAIAFALGVGETTGRISKKDAKAIGRALYLIKNEAHAAVNSINEILRAGLAARKRGDLKRSRA